MHFGLSIYTTQIHLHIYVLTINTLQLQFHYIKLIFTHLKDY